MIVNTIRRFWEELSPTELQMLLLLVNITAEFAAIWGEGEKTLLRCLSGDRQ
jgi:hypothetical protein